MISSDKNGNEVFHFSSMPYYYNVELVRVIDGDTIEVVLDFGFTLRQKMKLRLANIDCAELRSKDEGEREKAQEAKKFVEEKLSYNITWHTFPRNIRIQTLKTKKGSERQTFGRYVAVVYFRDDNDVWVNLNDLLVEEGHAVKS